MGVSEGAEEIIGFYKPCVCVCVCVCVCAGGGETRVVSQPHYNHSFLHQFEQSSANLHNSYSE